MQTETPLRVVRGGLVRLFGPPLRGPQRPSVRSSSNVKTTQSTVKTFCFLSSQPVKGGGVFAAGPPGRRVLHRQSGLDADSPGGLGRTLGDRRTAHSKLR